MSSEIDGSIALVTGAAGGIGRCISARLAAAGVALAVVDLDGGAAEAVLAELGAKGVALAADVSVPEEVTAAAAQAEERLGPVDILVNNAGISGVGPPKPAVDTPLEEWDKTLAVNVTAPFLFSRAVLPGMIERGRGRIVNVASMAGILCLPGRVSYAASKAALISLTKTLAVEAGASGVRINAVCPGWVDTAFIAARLAQPELRAQAEAMVPVGRVATPDEVADVVAFLLSPASRYMTGAAVAVDGGMSLL
ncbi:MAG: SDR family NAD(P)-dependent oxidoreductase [Actinomycetota bacterium]